MDIIKEIKSIVFFPVIQLYKFAFYVDYAIYLDQKLSLFDELMNAPFIMITWLRKLRLGETKAWADCRLLTQHR